MRSTGRASPRIPERRIRASAFRGAGSVGRSNVGLYQDPANETPVGFPRGTRFGCLDPSSDSLVGERSRRRLRDAEIKQLEELAVLIPQTKPRSGSPRWGGTPIAVR